MDIVYDYSDPNSNLFTLQYGKDCPDHLKLMDQFLQRIVIYEDGTVKVKFNTIRQFLQRCKEHRSSLIYIRHRWFNQKK